MNETIEKIELISDSIKLSGYLHLPSKSIKSFVIGSHGMLSDAESGKQIALASKLGKSNIGYLRFNHRGCKDSQGNIRETNLDTRKTDLLAAFSFLKKNFVFEKTGLFGSSMGGATILHAYADIKPDAIAVLATPVKGENLKRSFTNSIERLMEETGLPESFFIANTNFNLTPKLQNIKNILVLHGNKDEIVPFENGKTIYKKSGNKKKFIELDMANHRVEDEKNQKFFISETIKWFKKYLA